MQTIGLDPVIEPWRWRRRGGLVLLDARIGPARLHFTSRFGGVSDAPFDSLNLGRSVPDRPENVTENRRRLFEALQMDPQRVALAQLVHGAQAAVVGRAGLAPRGGLRPADGPTVDALVTDDPSVSLMMTFADCVPVFLVAPAAPACALAHAGWRGLAAGVLATATAALGRTAGTGPDGIWAAIGPCIGPSYQVDEPVMQRMRARYAWADRLQNTEGVFDMAGASRAALLEAGIAADRIVMTVERTESPAFFSHRSEHGRTGRMAGLVGLDATTI